MAACRAASDASDDHAAPAAKKQALDVSPAESDAPLDMTILQQRVRVMHVWGRFPH